MTSALVTAGESPSTRQLLFGKQRLRIRCGGESEKKAKPCYTSFALSDLDVSGGLPFLIKAIQPGTDFPPSPYSVTTSGWSSVLSAVCKSVVPDGNEPNGGRSSVWQVRTSEEVGKSDGQSQGRIWFSLTHKLKSRRALRQDKCVRLQGRVAIAGLREREAPEPRK
jgi:hypothetical protein